MPDLSSLRLNLAGRELVEESPRHRMWRDAAGVFLKVDVNSAPTDWPFDLLDADGARAFYDRQCREQFKGAMLEMAVVECAGHESLRGLFKYRSPVPNSMGMMYVHILWLPFRDWTAQVNFEAVERGATGAREAGVSLLEGPPAAASAQAPIAVSSVEEMFRMMRERPIVATPADDEKYDATFPGHPLSQVRSQIQALLADLVVNEPRARCAPYRIGAAPAPGPSSPPATEARVRARPWWKPW